MQTADVAGVGVGAPLRECIDGIVGQLLCHALAQFFAEKQFLVVRPDARIPRARAYGVRQPAHDVKHVDSRTEQSDDLLLEEAPDGVALLDSARHVVAFESLHHLLGSQVAITGANAGTACGLGAPPVLEILDERFVVFGGVVGTVLEDSLGPVLWGRGLHRLRDFRAIVSLAAVFDLRRLRRAFFPLGCFTRQRVVNLLVEGGVGGLRVTLNVPREILRPVLPEIFLGREPLFFVRPRRSDAARRRA